MKKNTMGRLADELDCIIYIHIPSCIINCTGNSLPELVFSNTTWLVIFLTMAKIHEQETLY